MWLGIYSCVLYRATDLFGSKNRRGGSGSGKVANRTLSTARAYPVRVPLLECELSYRKQIRRIKLKREK